jgi:hypothetical protein
MVGTSRGLSGCLAVVTALTAMSIGSSVASARSDASPARAAAVPGSTDQSATASGACRRFAARNNYALATGCIRYGTRGFTVGYTLRDTPQRPSSSYLYVTYDYRSGGKILRSNPTQTGAVRNGKSTSGRKWFGGPASFVRLTEVQATVCTRRKTSKGIWHCGKPFRVRK